VRCVCVYISRQRGGTSTPNILAVFAAADENKNFLFPFFASKFVSRSPFRRGGGTPPTRSRHRARQPRAGGY